MPDRPGWQMPPPRQRPPWWPENEHWPPLDADGQPVRVRHRRGGWPAIGCLVALIMVLALAGATFVAGQVLSLVLGPLAFLSRPFGVVALVVLLGAVVALIRGFRRLATPINALVDAARRVEQGEYAARVPELTRGPRELRELARAFNTMASRLEHDQQQRRSLLADVSHELRTPLAVLRGNLEAIADGVHAADEEHVAGLIEETRVLERLVEDLRTISLADAGALPLHRESTDPDVLLGETVESFRASASRKGVALTLLTPSDLSLVNVDPVRIREVVANLLANAIRHTPAGGAVTVTGARALRPTVTRPGAADTAVNDPTVDEPGISMTIADTGTGMAAPLLPHVFERFARGDDSPGSGLGLAIAWDLVTAHGGTIEVESELGRGTTFSVWLPSEQQDA